MFIDVSEQPADHTEHGAENKATEWKGISIL
jgi:hypothetical protein